MNREKAISKITGSASPMKVILRFWLGSTLEESNPAMLNARIPKLKMTIIALKNKLIAFRPIEQSY